MSEPKLIQCICPAPAGQVCQVPHDRWLSYATRGGVVMLTEPYPCKCQGRCDPNWCECAGRRDLQQVPQRCCAWTNTPEVVARAKHGGTYRTCWCRGDIDRHRTQVAPAVGLMDLPEDEEDDDA